jgi:pimeloyl-ACP methyl ester carboxylesterase
MLKWLKRIFIGFIVLLVLLAGIGLSTQAIFTSLDAAKYTPPGQRVDIDGFKLHLNCTGQGSPTVILEAGIGSVATSWALVQREVAKTTRVCSYDRAGYAWSDSGPLPRTSAQISKELHLLLTKAHENGPFVLAGHSFGGLNVRMFEHFYPTDVSGLILIDSLTEKALDSKLWAPLFSTSDSVNLLSRAVTRLGIPRLLFPNTMLENILFLPEEKAIIKEFSVATKSGLAFSDESYSMFQSLTEAKGQLGSIGSKPLIVIVAEKTPDFELIAGSKENGEIMKQEWIGFQKDLAMLSTNSAYLSAKDSSHMIPFEQPRIIVEAIKTMVEKIRAK